MKRLQAGLHKDGWEKDIKELYKRSEELLELHKATMEALEQAKLRMGLDRE